MSEEPETTAGQRTFTIKVEIRPRAALHLALGRMAWNIATLEGAVQMICWALISDDGRVGQAVTNRMTLNVLTQLIRRLSSNRDVLPPGEERLLIEILGRVDDIRIRRNRLIHSTWLVDAIVGDATFAFATLSTASTGKTHIAEVSAEDIDEVSKLASDTTTGLLDMVDRWIEANEVIAARTKEFGYERQEGKKGFSLRYQFLGYSESR